MPDEAPATPEAAAPEAAPEVPAGGTPPAGEPSFNEEQQAYVKSLRDEAAKYRTEAKPFKETFDGYTEAEVSYILNTFTSLKSDKVAGAHELRDLAFDLVGKDQATFEANAPWVMAAIAEAEAAEKTGPENAPKQEGLTAEDVQRMLAERDAKAQEESMIRDVNAEAATMGYEINSDEHLLLLQVAATVTGGDLHAAHQRINPGKPLPGQEEGEAEKPAFPAVSTGGAGAQPAPPTEAPKTLAEARERMEARFDAAPAQ